MFRFVGIVVFLTEDSGFVFAKLCSVRETEIRFRSIARAMKELVVAVVDSSSAFTTVITGLVTALAQNVFDLAQGARISGRTLAVFTVLIQGHLKESILRRV